jgi:hypothetical protein
MIDHLFNIFQKALYVVYEYWGINWEGEERYEREIEFLTLLFCLITFVVP